MVNSRVQSCTLVFKYQVSIDLIKASPLEIATLILLAFSRQNDSKHGRGRTLESTFSSYPPQVDVAPSGAESHSGGGGGAAGKRDRGEEKERKAMGK